MAKSYERLDDRLRSFITSQPMFFVATAPSSGGHVNVSPKGYQDTFAILGDHRVGYLDLYGSGAETIAHLRDNGRITLMFCSFARQPKILRLHGTGRAVRPDATEFPSLLENFGSHPGVRAIITVDIDRITDSCGYTIPFMETTGTRTLLDDQHARYGAEEWAPRVTRNTKSIDGLPALDPDHPLP